MKALVREIGRRGLSAVVGAGLGAAEATARAASVTIAASCGDEEASQGRKDCGTNSVHFVLHKVFLNKIHALLMEAKNVFYEWID
jgi:hypothetical protein